MSTSTQQDNPDTATSTEDNTSIRNAVESFMLKVAATEKTLLKRDPSKAFLDAITRLRHGIFRLVVVGEIKKGKSSFINALTGIPGLVPVQTDIATSTAFKIRYGKQLRYTVYSRADTQGQYVKNDIPATRIADYGTETGNPRNVKNVDFIAVEAPAPILRSGLLLVDTPGLGGLIASHREITWRHAPSADAIFFVTDSIESPIGSEEIAFLQELRKVTADITFIQTKTDTVATPAAHERMENNIATLHKIKTQNGSLEAAFPKGSLRYFCVSSKLKSVGDKKHKLKNFEKSGFPALLSHLDTNLIRRKDSTLCTISIHRTEERLVILKNELLEKRRLFEAKTPEARAIIQRDLDTAREALVTWERETQPAILREFQQSLGNIKTDIITEFTLIIRPGGSLSEEAGKTLKKAETPKAVYSSVPQLEKATRAAVAQALYNAAKQLQTEVEKLVVALAQKAGSQLSQNLRSLDGNDRNSLLSQINVTSLNDLVKKSEETHMFTELRTGLYGGMAGVMIAQIAGGLIGSVVPFVGTIIGSTIGTAIAGIIGCGLSSLDAKKQQTEKARHEVLGELNKFLGNAQHIASAEINKLTPQLENAAGAVLKQVIQDVRSQIENRAKELAAQRNKTEAELAAQRKFIAIAIATIQQLRKQATALLPKC